MKLCQACQRRFPDDATRFCPADGTMLVSLEAGGEDMDGPSDTGGEQPDPLIGQTVDGRYAIQSVLGRGGMGVVYLARQVTMNRLVAVKVLKQELTRDLELVKRFLREVQVASLLRHPHTITIHDFARSSDGILYFVMELLEGETLAALLEREARLPTPRALRLLVQVCHSLSEAHRNGVIHRDLKPENIFITQVPGMGDFVRVLDFGIAKIAAPELTTEQTEQTKTGLVYGTPHYMSPEQIRGEPLDPRADLYSLGVILYRMLAGVLPFHAQTAMGLLTKHLLEEPVPLRSAVPELELPPALDALVLRLLEKQPDRRYRDVEELKAAVESVREGMGLPSDFWAATGPSTAETAAAALAEGSPAPEGHGGIATALAMTLPAGSAPEGLAAAELPAAGLAGESRSDAELPRSSEAAGQAPPSPLDAAGPAPPWPDAAGPAPLPSAAATSPAGVPAPSPRSQPAIPSPSEPVVSSPSEPVVSSPSEPVISWPSEPVISWPSEPVISWPSSSPTPSPSPPATSPASGLAAATAHEPASEPAAVPALSRRRGRARRALLLAAGGVGALGLALVLLLPGVRHGAQRVEAPASSGGESRSGAAPASGASPSAAALPVASTAAPQPPGSTGALPALPPTVPPSGPSPALAAAPSGPEPPAASAGDPRSFPLVLYTIPPGAQVLQGNELLGATPLETTLPAGGAERVLRLRKPGYRDAELIVPPDAPFTRTVRLSRIAREPRPDRASTGAKLDDFKEMSF